MATMSAAIAAFLYLTFGLSRLLSMILDGMPGVYAGVRPGPNLSDTPSLGHEQKVWSNQTMTFLLHIRMRGALMKGREGGRQA